jgi:hypothetical protein
MVNVCEAALRTSVRQENDTSTGEVFVDEVMPLVSLPIRVPSTAASKNTDWLALELLAIAAKVIRHLRAPVVSDTDRPQLVNEVEVVVRLVLL